MPSFDTNCYGSGFVLTFLMHLQINILRLHLCYHNAEGETQAWKASVWEHAVFARLEPDSSRQAGKSLFVLYSGVTLIPCCESAIFELDAWQLYEFVLCSSKVTFNNCSAWLLNKFSLPITPITVPSA